MKILTMPQGSPEWWKARSGIPTASEFGRIVTPAKGQRSKGESYTPELIAETLGWRKTEFAGSPDIERGKIMESEARRWLAMELGEDIEEVGFCLSDCGRYGASPDGMIWQKKEEPVQATATVDFDAAIADMTEGRTVAMEVALEHVPPSAAIPVEIKCPDLHTLIKWKLKGGLPNDHKCQVHGTMWVTGAPYLWFMAYADHESIDNILIKVERDDFTEQLGEHVVQFCDDLAKLKREIIQDPAYFD